MNCEAIQDQCLSSEKSALIWSSLDSAKFGLKLESNLLVTDIQQSNLEALSGVIALRKELENDLQVEKDIAEEEEVEVAETAFKTFDLKNENDDLAVNIIRHFDFSKVGFVEDDEDDSTSILS